LTTNGFVITDAIGFIEQSKEKLKASPKEDDDRESNAPNYNEDSELGEEQEMESEDIISLFLIVAVHKSFQIQ
jgi:hypothetical protein